MESSQMANYVSNLIILKGNNVHMAKLAAGSKTSIFDFEKIMPTPSGLPEFTSHGCVTALAHHLVELDLDLVELENLLSPIEKILAVSEVIDRKNEYIKALNEYYSLDGSLKDKSLSPMYPDTREEFEKLGKRIYDLVKEHRALNLYDWRSLNWNTRSEAEGINSVGNEISFSTRWSSPFPVVEKWAKDHQLSLTYKVFESGCHWWYVAEFVDGMLVSKRDSVKADLRPLLKEIYDYTDTEIDENYIVE